MCKKKKEIAFPCSLRVLLWRAARATSVSPLLPFLCGSCRRRGCVWIGIWRKKITDLTRDQKRKNLPFLLVWRAHVCVALRLLNERRRPEARLNPPPPCRTHGMEGSVNRLSPRWWWWWWCIWGFIAAVLWDGASDVQLELPASRLGAG